MSVIKKILHALTKKEIIWFALAGIVFLVTGIGRFAIVIGEHSEIVPIEGGLFREGVLGQPRSINPILSSNPVDLDISSLVFSKLHDLLQNIEVSKDGRVYSLKLKESLKWDDGAPLNSDDVIFTIKVIQNPDNQSPLLKSWQGVIVERDSELQIKATLPAPYVFFEGNLKRLSVVPKHVWEKIPTDNLELSANNLRPVGNGPYRFKNLRTRRDGFIAEYQLARNPYFAGNKAYISNFYFNFYERDEDLLEAFRLRRINGFGKLMPPNSEMNNLSNTVIEKTLMPRYYAIFFNPIVTSLLKDKNLRLALARATPIDKILKVTTENEGKPIYGPVLRELVGLAPSESPFSYEPEEARKLLEKVKLPEGESSIELNLIVPQVDFLVKIGEILREEWQKIGIGTVNVIVLNPEDLVNEVVKTRNYEMVLFGNVFENPEDLFPFWYSSQRFYPGLNLALYQNLEVDKLIENIRQTENLEKRKMLLENLEKSIIGDYPAIFLFSLPYYYFHSDRLHGFETKSVVVPSDRFNGAEKWNLLRVRVLKQS